MATSNLSSGMLLGDMGEWYRDLMQNYKNAGVLVPGSNPVTTQGASATAPNATYLFDPGVVGGDIGQYYTAALSQQPGYTNILRNIEGVLSPDVKRGIAQAAAERGIGIGSYGGANDETALLAALGLSRKKISDQGIEQYRQAYAAVPNLSPTSLFVTPTDQAALNQRLQLAILEIQANQRRAQEAQAAAERLARIQQETTYGVTGANLAASRYGFETSRADRDALRAQQLSNFEKYWGASTGVGGVGGEAVSDRWYSGTNTELEQPTGLPNWWYQGAAEPRGTGSIYSGPELTDYEQNLIFSGAVSPEELGVYDYDLNLGY